MAKLFDTEHKFGRKQTEDLTKSWDVGLGASNPKKVWDSTNGKFDHNKVNNFDLGAQFGAGSTIETYEEGTWSIIALPNTATISSNTVSFGTARYRRINDRVEATAIIFGLAFTSSADGSATITPSGLPDLALTTEIQGGGVARVIDAGVSKSRSCMLLSSNITSVDFQLYAHNGTSGASPINRMLLQFYYDVV